MSFILRRTHKYIASHRCIPGIMNDTGNQNGYNRMDGKGVSNGTFPIHRNGVKSNERPTMEKAAAMSRQPAPGAGARRSSRRRTISGSFSVYSSKVVLKRTMSLFNGIGIILGTIIGSGIFVSPKGVLVYSGSVGLSLVTWFICGLVCMLGAHCFAELGTCIRKSGGMYVYIQEGIGDLPAFLYLWSALVIIFPAANAVVSLTCSYYVLQPIFPDCDGIPDVAVRLLAAVVIAFLVYINCVSVKWATRVQDIFMVIKIIALLLIIITALVIFIKGQARTENFTNIFEGSTMEPGRIALAFYSGLFSYSGWYTLNFLTEELKNPYKNLPRAIWISMIFVTIIYTLVNVAYFMVLTPDAIVQSDAVAVTFAHDVLGVMHWIMPICVAFSTFGGLNGCILSSSRVFFVGARQGHLPCLLSLIHVDKFTPLPSLITQGILAVAMLCTSDVYAIINYMTFIESLSFLASIISLLVLRYKHPEWERPIKVSLVWPIIFLLISLFLTIMPLISSPIECLMGLLILVSGIPAYAVGVAWKNKPASYSQNVERFTKKIQYFLLCVPAEKDPDCT